MSVVESVGPPGTKPTKFGWLRIMFLALLLTIVAVALTEWIWRRAGHRPTVYNTPELWAYHRRQLTRNGPDGVALLGSSRMLAAFSTDVFRQRFPHCHVAQLAIQGSSPVKALEDLTTDNGFHGTIICEFLEPAMAAACVDRYSYQEYLDRFHRGASPISEFELSIQARLQDRFCCFYPELSWNHQIRNRIELQRWQETRHVFMRYDRRQLVDYRLVNVAEAKAETLLEMQTLLKESLREIPSPAEWLHQVLTVEAAVKKLRTKGGRVVFVVLPATGTLWELEQRLFPKEKYWDRFAAATSATAIHFRDVPSLSATPCPDNFHLDFRDTDYFTDNLLDELVAKGVLHSSAVR
jgi:hypothetical protein